MRRQPELIKKILLVLQAHKSPWMPAENVAAAITEPEPDILAYHIDLCEQAGFIVRQNTLRRTSNSATMFPSRTSLFVDRSLMFSSSSPTRPTSRDRVDMP